MMDADACAGRVAHGHAHDSTHRRKSMRVSAGAAPNAQVGAAQPAYAAWYSLSPIFVSMIAWRLQLECVFAREKIGHGSLGGCLDEHS